MKGIRFAGVLLAVATAACAPPAARQSADLAAFDEDWEAAFNAGEVGQLVALYTDDARLLPPNAAMGRGAAAVEAEFVEMVASGLTIDLVSVEAMEAGDLGYSVGTYELKGADGAVVDRGKYVETLRKVAGAWKISNDIFNSDLPAGPVGTEMIIAHRVEDHDVWMAAWSGENSRAKMFAANGAPSVKIFTSPEDSSHHALLVGVSDMDAFTSWVGSDESKAAKAEDGVLDEDFVIFTPVE